MHRILRSYMTMSVFRERCPFSHEGRTYDPSPNIKTLVEFSVDIAVAQVTFAQGERSLLVRSST
jgi:hypothetical protein